MQGFWVDIRKPFSFGGMTMPADTIAAIATATAPAGLGVVRLSGPEAAVIADRVFAAVSGKGLSALKGYSAAFGRVFDGDGEIDEAVALRFAAPRSYTGEEVVELSVHGGGYLLQRLLRAVLDAGARLAGPGEFTRRAFENGKLDLTAAESVMDLVGATGDQAHRAALAARNGATFSAVSEVRDMLVGALADLAAWVDFPDEDVPAVDPAALSATLSAAQERLRRLLATASAGRILREGIDVVLAGKPNVGKSTIMNLLARCDRSIVTDRPGTTRDAVETTLTLGGVTVRLTDTAGLHETDDPVEAIGVSIANEKLETAQIVLGVLDRSRPLTGEDAALLRALAHRRALLVLNKADRPAAFDESDLPADLPRVVISAAQGDPRPLEDALRPLLGLTELDPAAGLLANERQLDCARQAARAVEEALEAVNSGVTLDAVGVCVEDALAALCELTGERVSEEIVEDVFRRFCVGK